MKIAVFRTSKEIYQAFFIYFRKFFKLYYILLIILLQILPILLEIEVDNLESKEDSWRAVQFWPVVHSLFTSLFLLRDLGSATKILINYSILVFLESIFTVHVLKHMLTRLPPQFRYGLPYIGKAEIKFFLFYIGYSLAWTLFMCLLMRVRFFNPTAIVIIIVSGIIILTSYQLSRLTLVDSLILTTDARYNFLSLVKASWQTLKGNIIRVAIIKVFGEIFPIIILVILEKFLMEFLLKYPLVLTYRPYIEGILSAFSEYCTTILAACFISQIYLACKDEVLSRLPPLDDPSG